jgi:hypothetical protein
MRSGGSFLRKPDWTICRIDADEVGLGVRRFLTILRTGFQEAIGCLR